MESGAPISVLIVDDHQMMAEGLTAAVATDARLEVVGVAPDLPEARDLTDRLRPDVVLLDYRLPSGNGAEGTRALKQVWPGTKVVVITGQHDDECVIRSIEAGCDGFLRKTTSVADLVDAVVRAQAGEAVFSAADLSAAMNDMRERQRVAEAGPKLTGRELEVLRLMADGTSTEDMAATLFVSVHTVRTHVRHILEKLDAHSKLEAVVIATRERLIEPKS